VQAGRLHHKGIDTIVVRAACHGEAISEAGSRPHGSTDIKEVRAGRPQHKTQRSL
jgi:hypothetical protein